MMNKTMPPSTLGVSFRLTNYKITILNYPYYPFIYHKFISLYAVGFSANQHSPLPYASLIVT